MGRDEKIAKALKQALIERYGLLDGVTAENLGVLKAAARTYELS